MSDAEPASGSAAVVENVHAPLVAGVDADQAGMCMSRLFAACAVLLLWLHKLAPPTD